MKTTWQGMYDMLEQESFDEWAQRMVALDEADYRFLAAYNGPPTERFRIGYDEEFPEEPPTLPPTSATTIRALPPTVAPRKEAA